uniref:Reverse transcriptase domain-containing protein n=1 Tax=Tanacetum cinerariifolium TaxID=118510 RepID=A0A6L2JBI8_TANCI|nr:reverse transcriptase domain-containing protein [Tanacetum cinerariifolium]
MIGGFGNDEPKEADLGLLKLAFIIVGIHTVLNLKRSKFYDFLVFLPALDLLEKQKVQAIIASESATEAKFLAVLGDEARVQKALLDSFVGLSVLNQCFSIATTPKTARGLPRSIEGNVTASKSQTLEEAINISHRLMDQHGRWKMRMRLAASV